MSLVQTIEAEFAKARSDVGAAVEFFTHKAETALQAEVEALKASEAKLAGDVKTAIEQAKAAALADVQANAPEAAALFEKALSGVEQAVLAALGSSLVP